MTVKRKSVKAPSPMQAEIDRIIGRGGRTTAENEEHPLPATPAEEEIRFTLRLPRLLIQGIDQARKKRPGNVSRNQWIIETLTKTLKLR